MEEDIFVDDLTESNVIEITDVEANIIEIDSVSGPEVLELEVEDDTSIVAIVSNAVRPAGDSPLNRYEFQQSSPSSTWTINHNFGYYPASIVIKTLGGVVVEAEVAHINANQTIVTFNTNFAGTATLI